MRILHDYWTRRIVLGPHKAAVNLRGKVKETLEEFLARGGKIVKCKSNCFEIPTRWAMPTNPKTNLSQHIYDWRV